MTITLTRQTAIAIWYDHDLTRDSLCFS